MRVTTKKRSGLRDELGKFAADEDAEKKLVPKKKKAAKRTKNCKRYAKQQVSEEWPEIVKGLVTKAKHGSYNHTKLLVEVSGIKDEEVKPVRRGQSRLTKILLKKLGEKEAER